ncbi:MAG: LapA family protein [Rhodobacter sp.]|nr:LapA family protein [Rhodobacter sp.]
MRYIRYAILAAIAIVLVTVAMANRGPATLNLLPAEVGALMGYEASVTLPLFIVIFLGVIAGILLGFFWEWMREHKHRADAATQRREKERLAREVEKMKTVSAESGDDVLALLDKAQ